MTTPQLSRSAFDRLQAEFDDLTTRGRIEVANKIERAREEGDLKENAEYHVAKEDQAHMETRIKRLQERLRNAVVVEVSELDSDVFSFGRSAEVLDESKDETNVWTLVGSTEANLAEGRLSAESPIGRALMDARVGSTVKVETPKGDRSFKVLKIVS
jgi:transcription elongation factor GreA